MLNSIQLSFKNYLRELNRDNVLLGENQTVDYSIYSNQDEFKKFVEEQYGTSIDIEGMSVDEILAEINTAKEQGFQEIDYSSLESGSNETTPEAISDELTSVSKSTKNDSFSKIGTAKLNSFFNSGSTQRIFDSDGDGKLSDDEKQFSGSLLSHLSDDGKVSYDTLSSFESYIDSIRKNNPDLSDDELNDAILADLKSLDGDKSQLSENDFIALREKLANSKEVGGVDAMGGLSDTAGGSRTSDSSDSSSTELSFENMSVEQLQTELATRNEAVKANQDKLREIIGGTDAKTVEMKANMDKAYETFKEALSKQDAELAQELDTNRQQVQAKEQEIAQKDVEIFNKEQEIYNIDTQIGSLNATKSALEAQKSSLSGKMDGDKAQEAASKMQALEAKIAEVESQIAALKEQKTQLEAQKTELETQKTELVSNDENGLTALQAKLAETEGKVSQLCESSAESNPDLKAQFDAYSQAQQAFDNYKNTEIPALKQAAQTELDNARNEAKTIQDLIDKKQANKTAQEYSVGGFGSTHEISDGTVFDVIEMEGFDSLTQFVDYAANAGLFNQGKFGRMQCMNYSMAMGSIMLGKANPELLKAFLAETEQAGYGDLDKAGDLARFSEYNPRNFAPVKAASREEQFAIMANELKNGRPCNVAVAGYSHHVLAVGLRQGATEPYQETDFLIIDTWEREGCMQRLGTSRKASTGNGGAFVYREDYMYSNTRSRLYEDYDFNS